VLDKARFFKYPVKKFSSRKTVENVNSGTTPIILSDTSGIVQFELTLWWENQNNGQIHYFRVARRTYLFKARDVVLVWYMFGQLKVLLQPHIQSSVSQISVILGQYGPLQRNFQHVTTRHFANLEHYCFVKEIKFKHGTLYFTISPTESNKRFLKQNDGNEFLNLVEICQFY